MAVTLQMHFGIITNFGIFHKSSSKKGGFCQAKMLASSQNVKTNYYQLLSLESKDAGLHEIKKAYRSKALKYHPDIYQAASMKEESTRCFLEIQQAYETLSDPISREIYNYELGLLTDCSDRGYGNWNMGSRKSEDGGLCREVWERQMQGLKMKSSERMEKRRNKGMQ